MIFLFKKYFILVLILLIASVSIYSNDVRADKPGYDLQKYLKTSLKESRELKEEEINITEKEIALEKEIADQELSPSPLLLKKAELELRLAECKDFPCEKGKYVWANMSESLANLKSLQEHD